MDTELHQRLIKDTEELRNLVRSASTESVVGMCAADHLARVASTEAATQLLSPGRQPLFLLGLMLTTPEPEKPREFGPNAWLRSTELLNAIFSTYAWMFWPKPEDIPSLTDRWWESRGVAMPAFLHYFNTPLLASVEQISNRVKLYLAPFDERLKSELRISASEALDITDWIVKSFQNSLDEMQEAAKKERQARVALLDRAQSENWDLERIRHEAKQEHYLPYFERLMTALQRFLRVPLESLRKEFESALADSYWNLFVSTRGELEDFTYLTERNIAEEKPLFRIRDEVALCPSVNALYNAILIVGEDRLLACPARNSFLKRRDKALEEEAERHLRKLFGESADYLDGVYETQTLQHEHDLIIRWDRRLFVIEAKASPPVEPFRDPEKAFTRIKRAFRSDRGIQKAYEQSDRIRKHLASGKVVHLYDSSGVLVMTIQPDEIDNTYCVCVSRDDFGALAADLSLLLEKAPEDPYPWAVNILDLENLVDAWDYFKWGPKQLCDYLDARRKLHGKVFTSDELEIAGHFVEHGGLHWLVEAKADRLCLTPDYSDVFDRIYRARRGGEAVVYNPINPFLGDMRKMLGEAIRDDEKPFQERTFRAVKKQGRNEPCACGSGKKYKRCCGRNT